MSDQSGYTPSHSNDEIEESRIVQKARSTSSNRNNSQRRRSSGRLGRYHVRSRSKSTERSISQNTNYDSDTDQRRRNRYRQLKSRTSELKKNRRAHNKTKYINVKKYRKSRYLTSMSSSSSHYDEPQRRSRSKSRSSMFDNLKRRRTRSSSRSSLTLRKIARFFNRTERSFEGSQSAIPEFNPDANDQTVEDWVRKVNETADIYGWSERQTIYYAIPKLAGHAKKWYQGRSTINLSWREWQKMIIKAFPNDRNYADQLNEMLERKSRREESLEDYFHDKARLVKMCGITGRNAVDCITSGIFDNNIRLNAQGLNFNSSSKLLTYLRRITKQRNIILPRKSLMIADKYPNKIHLTPTTQRPSNSHFRKHSSSHDMQCYNCLEMGHSARFCQKPKKICEKCSRLGHDIQKCEAVAQLRGQNRNHQRTETIPNTIRKNEQTENVMKISYDKGNDQKYFKTVIINDISCSGYIDFGSQCTLIRKKFADVCNLNLRTSDLPVIKGFAFGSVTPLGSAEVDVAIDAVKASVEIYVVDDHLLETDVLIGQSLTELPNVVAHKTSTSLVLYCDDTESKKINVYIASDISVCTGICNIDVKVNEDFTGVIFIPGSVCLKLEKEYILLQGLYQVADGISKVLMANICTKAITFRNNQLLTRATRFMETQTPCSTPKLVSVNHVTSDTNPLPTNDRRKDPITMDMLNIEHDTPIIIKEKLLNLINKFRDCFALDMQELGVTHIAKMSIKLNDDVPVAYKPYRLPYSEREKVRAMIGDLMAAGFIRESQSAYASPIVLVRKKNGEYRLCVDYRALNRKTVKNSYPMPMIEDQLDRICGKSLFTSLDLASGYYQIPLAEDTKHITAFVTPDGHYEYTRMPFGLVNAPAVFQSMINKALGQRRFDLALPYLDDLLCSASTVEEMLEKLAEIFSLLRNANLTLNLKKCHFLQTKIDYLGFEISKEGLKPGHKKIQAVNDFPKPTNVHQIRQFVGLASFFRRFVYNFASIAKPLTKLTKANTAWEWSEQQENSFQYIKSKLVTRPILALYNPNYITEVHCDASKVGVGGILLQKPTDDTQLQPVAYFSRQNTREEEFWHSYELETMAVVLTLQKFRVYLIGIEFKVITDCNALRLTLTKRDLLPKVARWWLILQEYNFTIEYKPGHNMHHVDALSRNPIIEEEKEVRVLKVQAKDWLYGIQMSDPQLKIVKEILQKGENDIKDIINNYAIREDKIYRKVGNRFKWVVPNSARWKICQMNHDEAGHFSVEKTLERISSDFWFPKMRRFVTKYVKSCINCAYNKEMSGKQSGELHPIPKVSAIFHTIHIDHLGPFIKSKRGNTYILGIIDAFSKFIFIRGVRNTKTKTTIKILEDIFMTFGYPEAIISDQGTSFTSTEFKNYTNSIGTKHIRNAVATPRANGQIERYNRTILNSLAAMNHGHDEKDWDLKLGKLQWSLNNTINRSTGMSPAEVVFGQKTVGHPESVIKNALNQIIQTRTNEDREKLKFELQQNIEEYQDKMKKAYDKHKAPTKIFSVDDLVMIPNNNPEKGKSKKLAPKFKGPYKITKKLQNDRYEVSSIQGHSNRKYTNIFSADKLKPWITMNQVKDHSDSESEGSLSD